MGSNFEVIATTPHWILNGVNVFSANLMRGLIARGVSTRIVLTGRSAFVQPSYALPAGVPVEHLPGADLQSFQARWGMMIRYLEAHAPCIYMPNYDYLYSCVSPKLSNRVAIVGNIHSPSEEHYEHFRTLGRYWNATVVGSKALESEARALCPELSSRVIFIPYGVPLPSAPSERTFPSGGPLTVVYSGRLVQKAKQVLDLPKIVEGVAARDVPVRLTVTGGGAGGDCDEDRLKAVCAPLVARGLVRFAGVLRDDQLEDVFKESDVFLLTSEYEGTPLALIQAMGHGCVPVVTNIPSGVIELVRDGLNGFVAPVGGIEAFIERLVLLYHDPARRQALARNAFATVDKGGYRLDDMVQRYLELFEHLWRQVELGAYRRPSAGVTVPPFVKVWLRSRWKERLPSPVQVFGGHCKRLLRRAFSGQRTASSSP